MRHWCGQDRHWCGMVMPGGVVPGKAGTPGVGSIPTSGTMSWPGKVGSGKERLR